MGIESGFISGTLEERVGAIEAFLMQLRGATFDTVEVTNTLTVDGSLSIQGDNVANHLAKLDLAAGQSLEVQVVGVTIAHVSQASGTMIKFSDKQVSSTTVPGTFGTKVVAAWIILNDHLGNHPIFTQMGYLGVYPAGNQVVVSGSANPSLAPTNFSIYILYYG